MSMSLAESQNQDSRSIVKLDCETSSAIRKGQLITKISDVVRELVDNSVDAGAPTIQILLNNFGLDKIEVRDTGHGIDLNDFKNAVAGGYTSKLQNDLNLSCSNSYGFRGEAISSICNVAYVSVITKTSSESQATKFVLDRNGAILSENKVAYGKGTIVTAEKIFSNYPVRRQWIQDSKKCKTELKDIEGYLKAIAIANCQTHISLYHNGSLIFTKASVPAMNQALITVLGHRLATQLFRCGPVNVEVDEEIKQSRTMEAFILKKPVDMKTMSFTSNALTMIFVNRKRVYVREFEKLIQRYVAAIVEKPAPADQRRFPVAVLNICLPCDEADFNRDIDKSKVFLVHKDKLSKKLEEVLINYYGIDLRKSLEKERIISSIADIENENYTEVIEIEDSTVNDPTAPEILIQKKSEKTDISEGIEISPVVPIRNSKDPQERKNSISAFLENIPCTSSSNFSQSPVKLGDENNVYFTKPKCLKKLHTDPVNDLHPVECSRGFGELGNTNTLANKSSRETGISNFNLNIDDWCYTQTQEQASIENSAAQREAPAVNLKDWVHGRITDPRGDLIQNVVINKPPSRESFDPTQESTGQLSKSNPFKSSIVASPTVFGCKINSGFYQTSPYDIMGPSAAKRLRTSEPETIQNNDRASPSGMSFSSPKQVTLDAYKNWGVPETRLQSFISTPNAPTGIRIPLSGCMRTSTPRSRKNENSVGLPSKSIRDYWSGSSSVSSDNLVGGVISVRRSVNLEENKTSTSHSSTSSSKKSSSKIIGEISGTDYYAARVHELVGIFSPMALLHLYPSLKYDLKVSFKKVQDSSPESVTSKYVISKDSVMRLFENFSTVVDPSSEPFSKIFYCFQDMKQLESQVGVQTV